MDDKEAFLCRYASYYRDADGTLSRELIKAYGILFVFTLDGEAGKFSVVPLFLNIGAGLALLGIVSGRRSSFEVLIQPVPGKVPHKTFFRLLSSATSFCYIASRIGMCTGTISSKSLEGKNLMVMIFLSTPTRRYRGTGAQMAVQ